MQSEGVAHVEMGAEEGVRASPGAGRGTGAGGLSRPGHCLQSTGQWPKPAGVGRIEGGRTREPGASSVVPGYHHHPGWATSWGQRGTQPRG